MDPPPIPVLPSQCLRLTAKILLRRLQPKGGFKFKIFWPAFSGYHRGTQGGGVSQPNAPPPYPFRLWLLLATFGKRSAFGVPFVLKGTEGNRQILCLSAGKWGKDRGRGKQLNSCAGRPRRAGDTQGCIRTAVHRRRRGADPRIPRPGPCHDARALRWPLSSPVVCSRGQKSDTGQK